MLHTALLVGPGLCASWRIREKELEANPFLYSSFGIKYSYAPGVGLVSTLA